MHIRIIYLPGGRGKVEGELTPIRASVSLLTKIILPYPRGIYFHHSTDTQITLYKLEFAINSLLSINKEIKDAINTLRVILSTKDALTSIALDSLAKEATKLSSSLLLPELVEVIERLRGTSSARSTVKIYLRLISYRMQYLQVLRLLRNFILSDNSQVAWEDTLKFGRLIFPKLSRCREKLELQLKIPRVAKPSEWEPVPDAPDAPEVPDTMPQAIPPELPQPGVPQSVFEEADSQTIMKHDEQDEPPLEALRPDDVSPHYPTQSASRSDKRKYRSKWLQENPLRAITTKALLSRRSTLDSTPKSAASTTSSYGSRSSNFSIERADNISIRGVQVGSPSGMRGHMHDHLDGVFEMDTEGSEDE